MNALRKHFLVSGFFYASTVFRSTIKACFFSLCGKTPKSNIMKKLILFFAVAIAATSCRQVEERGLQSVTPVIIAGEWKVNLLLRNGVNNTSEINSYRFEFYPTGVVEAGRSGESVLGSWTEGTDKKSIEVNFSGGSASLQSVNGTWHVMDISTGLINFDALGESSVNRLTLSY
jgi:hypothetical protein